MENLNNENAYVILEAGETYRFAGYDWTVCEVDKEHHTAVIQSHGVTSGAWPGFKMAEFGNGDYYVDFIDGQNISGYDDKMQALYNAIKDAEDSSVSYGKGLFLINKEKAGFAKWGQPGFGNYWQALKKAAENARSFWAASSGAWLGTVGSSSGAWCVGSGGYVYGGVQYGDFVVAPAFNLDLSKVKVMGDEIIFKETYEKTKNVKKARLILAVTEQVSEDNFERHYKTVEIEVPENKHMNLSKCDIIGGEWIS